MPPASGGSVMSMISYDGPETFVRLYPGIVCGRSRHAKPTERHVALEPRRRMAPSPFGASRD